MVMLMLLPLLLQSLLFANILITLFFLLPVLPLLPFPFSFSFSFSFPFSFPFHSPSPSPCPYVEFLDSQPAGLKFVVKPARSSGSDDVFLCSTKEDIRQRMSEILGKKVSNRVIIAANDAIDVIDVIDAVDATDAIDATDAAAVVAVVAVVAAVATVATVATVAVVAVVTCVMVYYLTLSLLSRTRHSNNPTEQAWHHQHMRVVARIPRGRRVCRGHCLRRRRSQARGMLEVYQRIGQRR